MKALILVKDSSNRLMSPLIERPFLQHVVEQLVQRGVRLIDVLLPPGAHEVEGLLGDGARWGIELRRLVVEKPSYEAAKYSSQSIEPLWIGPADRLPFLPDAERVPAQPAMFFESDGSSSRWSGWVALREGQAARFARHGGEELNWKEASRDAGLALQKVFLDRPSLSAASPRDLLKANRMVLEGRWPGLYFWGKEVRPAVWVARGAKIHKLARIEPPCYIGENAWIAAGCQIGPSAVIAANSVIERGTVVLNSVVSEGTYLGPGLEVSDCVVESNRIHNVRLDAEVAVQEPHIVSNLRSSNPGLLRRLAKKTVEAMGAQ